ncbi:MAG: cation-translocating P-type ATPase [Dialister hominis]|jgi:heavy metal translocating P-type ATPase|uniref:heavy metal translocating P-type ATPase n=1 Tax=Dialister hominis TaxID=2582419 RepID=UPI002EC6E835|nr:cation-translocating P-type ATPase [Eubacterium sp.]MEE1350390.1 cation-translocating P-type ATPase [Dialister hominis]
MLNHWLENEPKETLVCAVISVISLVLSITGALMNLLPFDIAWMAIILCGIPILVGAFKGVICEHDIKADLLVSLALIASVATKEFFAAGEVALIMQIGSLLEDYTSGKAREGIEKLINIRPQTARVLRDEIATEIPVEQVKVGDVISVIAGETVPVDGTILEGETSIDQSVMTGESIPVDKAAGDTVSSGTINQFGTFIMRADSISENSSLQRMVRLAEEAEENKAPIVTAADRWATWLVVIALSCAIITWIVTGQFMRAVTVLVVFCPCAFILATPTAVLAGIGNAAKYGIVVRSGDAVERLSTIKRVAFDKTGTITYGKPQVTAFVSVDKAYSDNGILRIAALAEQKSEHPLGKAIWDAYEKSGGKNEAISDFRVIAGQGISAVVDGKTVRAGKEGFMKEQGVDISACSDACKPELDKGATAVYIATDKTLIGFIALRDTVREDAKATIEKLKSIGITPMLLTGDNEQAASAIAGNVGINDVRANLLPEEKMNIIKSYSVGADPICMIGDGVNDALALTSADAGIAMGGIGSDIAVESADAVLVSDDIKRLPYLFNLMQKVMRKVHVNIIASLVINLAAVVLSAIGILTPVTGALWHNCGSVFVVVNAAFLLHLKDE